MIAKLTIRLASEIIVEYTQQVMDKNMIWAR